MITNSQSERSTRFFPGLYTGRGETVEDHGRIQVSVPAVFDQDVPEAFVWARPCLPYGHFFVPEIGDQVWVAFENGDPSAPVWLGTWYPQGGVPAEADAEPPVKRVIKSSKGHLIIMDDTDDDEALILQDQSGNSIEMRSGEMVIRCQTNLTIDASGHEVVIRASSVDIQQG